MGLLTALWRRATSLPGGRLWLLGLGAEVIYLLAFTLRFPLLEHYRDLVDIGQLTNYGGRAAAAYLIAIVGLFALYLLGWRHAQRLSFSEARWPILSFALVFGLTNLFLYPITAIDIYNYIAQARVWVYYGENPLMVPPAAFPYDSLMRYAGGWGGHPSPYGPLWVLLSALPSRVAGADLLVNLLWFKGLALFFYLGCGLLAVYILGRIDPARQAAGVLLLLWNPLMLIESVGNGHNDVVMTFFVLAAVAVVQSRWGILGLAALCLSVLTKYTAVILLPVIFLYLVQQQPGTRQKIFFSALLILLAAALVVLLFVPFWAGRETFTGILMQGKVFISSPAAILSAFLDEIIPRWSIQISTAVPALILGIFYLTRLWGLSRGRGSWLQVAFEVSFYAMFALARFETWYMIWPLALAALNPRGLIPLQAVFLSFTALLSVLIFGYLWVWRMPEWDLNFINLVAVPAIFLPVVVFSLWQSSKRLPAT